MIVYSKRCNIFHFRAVAHLSSSLFVCSDTVFYSIMPKTRMTALDVRACVNELKATVLGSKVINMFHWRERFTFRYDVSNKVYVIKSVRGGIQHNILVESGVRQVS